MKYTQGKWEITGTSIFAGGDYRKIVAQAFDPDKPLNTTPIAQANARLIASAPRMIEFIQKLARGGNKKASGFIQTLAL